MNTLLKTSILLLLFMISCSPKYPLDTEAKTEILAVMSMQEKAWSNGDIETFMAGYWQSPQLAFVGKSGVTRGWQQTLDNYKKSYPSKEKMGQLSFEVIELEKVSQTTYHMIGKYTLTLQDSTPSGHFTLLWQYIDGQWLIVKDHSS